MLWNLETVPEVVIRPIAWVPSVNQRAPSAPLAIPDGFEMRALPKTVTVPVGVMVPIALLTESANHKSPSGPAVMPSGPVTPAKRVTLPLADDDLAVAPTKVAQATGTRRTKTTAIRTNSLTLSPFTTAHCA
jgi:hypothetical protein